MEETPSHTSKKILNFTLEIIYLLTGEDYELVKKVSSESLKHNSSPEGSPPITVTTQDSMTPNTNNDKKILEVIKKMMELLTGEEWEYLGQKDLYKDVMMEDHPKGHKDLTKEVAIEGHQQGHKDLYKNVMMECQKRHKDNKKVRMEDHQSLLSMDGSSHGNPPERCPRPLYSRDSTQEGHRIPHHHQVDASSHGNLPERCPRPLYSRDSTQDDDFIFDQLEELMDINDEIKRVEEEFYVRDGQQSTEEDVVMVTTEQEESSLNLSTDGSSHGNPPERCPHPLYSRDATQEGHTINRHRQSGKFQGYNIVVKEEFKDEDEEYGVMKECSEGHKNVMKKVHNKRNPPERCPRPLYSRDSTQEGHTIPHHHQVDGSSHGNPPERSPCPLYSRDSTAVDHNTQFSQAEDLSDMKIEIKEEDEEEETYMMDDHVSTEEAGTMVAAKKEDSSLEISSDDLVGWNSSIGHPFPDTKDNGTTQYSPVETFANQKLYPRPVGAEEVTPLSRPKEPSGVLDPTSSKVHPGLYSMDRPLDAPNPEESPALQRFDEMSTTSSYNECFTIITLPLVYQPTANENHPFICSECGKCFQTRSSLIRHENIHSGMRPYSCSVCGKGFTAKSHLERHEKNHTGDRPYSCPECDKCFKQKDRLNAHLRVHKGETPFTCGECKKSFIDKAHFVSHQRVHTGEKPFSCPECGKCFSQTGHLNIHLRLHTGEKAFSCSECGKSFTHKSTLINHQRFHTGEQPFSCTVCGKRFTRKMNLDIHQKFNTKDSTSSCWECGMQYRTKCEMKIHQKVHPKKKIYSCSMCPKSFSYKSEFLRHQRSHTS